MSRLIDENDIIKMLNTMDRYTSEELTLCDTDKTFPMNEVFIVDDVFEGLDELPSAQPEVLACGEGELYAQPEREKGHWIDKTDPDWDGEWDDWQCSCCGSLITSMAINLNGLYLYCPNCGARMEGER